jgi:hypothetical protein
MGVTPGERCGGAAPPGATEPGVARSAGGPRSARRPEPGTRIVALLRSRDGGSPLGDASLDPAVMPVRRG